VNIIKHNAPFEKLKIIDFQPNPVYAATGLLCTVEITECTPSRKRRGFTELVAVKNVKNHPTVLQPKAQISGKIARIANP
jgi:hypothetical protein